MEHADVDRDLGEAVAADLWDECSISVAFLRAAICG